MTSGSCISFLLFISLTLIVLRISGQSLIDPELQSLFSIKDTLKHDHLKPLRESRNEIGITFSLGFYLYKEFISSQDVPRCVFTPSCSEYAVEAIQKKGIFIGWLSSFDRLSRCHGFVKKEIYPFEYQKNRFYDPVQ